jgi:pyridoxal phosphate enzyme (YggS family)
VAELIQGLEVEAVRAQLARARERIAAAAARAGRDPAGVEIVAATKYVAAEEMGTLAQAGILRAGENRAQDLQAKHDVYGDRFTWDFIGHLQSRKVPQVLPLVDRIHSVGSDSVLDRLARHAELARPGLELLVEVNVAGEEGKSGIAPSDLGAFLERCTIPPVGLMTMPPLAEGPDDSRRWFAALRELAAEHGLEHLSMGTTQDFEVAVEEGATIVRLGSVLFRSRNSPAEG